MKRLAVSVLTVVALAGCGGGGSKDSTQQQLQDTVKAKADKVRERVEKAGAKAKVVDKALLQIQQSDLPDDVKQQLLEAKELLDKYQP